MQVFKDFKEFALKWNVIDLAVWVIIGTAFGKIVSSLVGDVIMPLIGWLLKMVDLTKLSYAIPSVAGAPAVVVTYGKFLQVTFDFVIIAAVVFALISLVNKALKKPMKEEKKPAEDIVLLTEIRDALLGKKPQSRVANPVEPITDTETDTQPKAKTAKKTKKGKTTKKSAKKKSVVA